MATAIEPTTIPTAIHARGDAGADVGTQVARSYGQDDGSGPVERLNRTVPVSGSAQLARSNTRMNSRTPWSSVDAGPKLGLGMPQSAKVIGMVPLTSILSPLRRATTSNVTERVLPRM